MEWLTKKLLARLDFDIARQLFTDTFRESLVEWTEKTLTDLAKETKTDFDDELIKALIKWLQERK